MCMLERATPKEKYLHYVLECECNFSRKIRPIFREINKIEIKTVDY